MEQFSEGPINIVVPNFRNSWTTVMKGDRHSVHFYLPKKCSHYGVGSVLNS